MKSKGTVFIEHIKGHLAKIDLDIVICKICGKSVEEIYREYKEKKKNV